jgi:hypothetical protein
MEENNLKATWLKDTLAGLYELIADVRAAAKEDDEDAEDQKSAKLEQYIKTKLVESFKNGLSIGRMVPKKPQGQRPPRRTYQGETA